MDKIAIDVLVTWAPALIAITGTSLVLWGTNRIFRRNLDGEVRVVHQIIMLMLTAVGVLVVIFALPLTETGRGQLLSLLGIVVTAVIALSSTTFVANVMAGLMLRAVNSFRPGDFIRSQDYFGRVTERGIFHTEIQTEDRDLTTIPNMYLVTNPVTVVHGSGTIISANLSLGYDVPHSQVEELLRLAAEQAELEDAFVLVGELGDFSVSYRVGGFSPDVSRLLTAKSNLRKQVLDVLHENGIEIVSPNFMNQRVLPEGKRMVPQQPAGASEPQEESAPEEVIFDKADTAAELEARRQALADARAELETLDKRIKEAPDEAGGMAPARKSLLARIERLESQLENNAREN